jgi:hypothetical protein
VTSLFDPEATRAFLVALHSGTIGLRWLGCRDNGKMTGRVFPVGDIAAAVAFVGQLATRPNPPASIYARVTPLLHTPPRGQRGLAEDSAAFPGLWADFDIAGPGHKTDGLPLPLPPDEDAVRAIIAEAGWPQSTVEVWTGGGLHAYVLLDQPPAVTPETFANVKALSEGWQRALVDAAARLGFHYGNVGDLARLMRVPGTVNRKVPDDPQPVRLERVDGPRYRPDQLTATMPAAPAAAPPPRRERPAPTGNAPHDFMVGVGVFDRGPGPFDALAETARWADLFEPVGWSFVGAERDGAELWKRPGATSEYSARCGRNGVPTAVVWSTDAGLPSGPGQKLTMGKLLAHLHFGGDESAAARDLLAAAAGDLTAGPARGLPPDVLSHIAARCLSASPSAGTHGQNRQNPVTDPLVPGSVDSVTASEGSWVEEPLPLGETPPPLPTDALGHVLGPLVDAIAVAYEVPSDLAVNLALPMITTAIAGRWTVQITSDWQETLALATLSGLASGERKSPVQRTLAAPLRAHEQRAQQAASFRISRQAAERKIAEDRAEKLRKTAVSSGTVEDREHYVDACLRLQDLVVEPLPRWLVDDATPEALAGLLAAHGAVGAVSAEPGMFSILAGRYSNGPNVEVVLKATSGDPFVVDRVGRDPVRVDRPALSLSMCVQPGRLGELGGSEKAFRASGLLARLQYVLPAPRVGTRSTESGEVPQAVQDVWAAHLEKLLTADPAHPVVTLDPDAREVLDEHRRWLEPQLDPRGGQLAGIADWGSKLPGTIARIAAALALLADPTRATIDADTMRDAVRVGEAYIPHALAAFGVIHASDDRLDRARQVLAWLRKNGQPTVKLRDLHRALQGRAWVDSADDVRAAVAVLGVARIPPSLT